MFYVFYKNYANMNVGGVNNMTLIGVAADTYGSC